jgi:hypothetical protein
MMTRVHASLLAIMSAVTVIAAAQSTADETIAITHDVMVPMRDGVGRPRL